MKNSEDTVRKMNTKILVENSGCMKKLATYYQRSSNQYFSKFYTTIKIYDSYTT